MFQMRLKVSHKYASASNSVLACTAALGLGRMSLYITPEPLHPILPPLSPLPPQPMVCPFCRQSYISQSKIVAPGEKIQWLYSRSEQKYETMQARQIPLAGTQRLVWNLKGWSAFQMGVKMATRMFISPLPKSPGLRSLGAGQKSGISAEWSGAALEHFKTRAIGLMLAVNKQAVGCFWGMSHFTTSPSRPRAFFAVGLALKLWFSTLAALQNHLKKFGNF